MWLNVDKSLECVIQQVQRILHKDRMASDSSVEDVFESDQPSTASRKGSYGNPTETTHEGPLSPPILIFIKLIKSTSALCTLHDSLSSALLTYLNSLHFKHLVTVFHGI